MLMRVDETRCTGAAAKHCGDPTIPGTADIACTSIGPLPAFILGSQGGLIDFSEGVNQIQRSHKHSDYGPANIISKRGYIPDGCSKDARLLDDSAKRTCKSSDFHEFQLPTRTARGV